MEGGGVRSTVHQYLQESGPALEGGQIKKQSLSPHRPCQPTPNDAPDKIKPHVQQNNRYYIKHTVGFRR